MWRSPCRLTSAAALSTAQKLSHGDCSGTAAPQAPEGCLLGCPLLQIINASKRWMEGKEVRGRIYFSEQARCRELRVCMQGHGGWKNRSVCLALVLPPCFPLHYMVHALLAG